MIGFDILFLWTKIRYKNIYIKININPSKNYILKKREKLQ